ncbi:CR4, partial [Symbiodinium pilosum]
MHAGIGANETGPGGYSRRAVRRKLLKRKLRRQLTANKWKQEKKRRTSTTSTTTMATTTSATAITNARTRTFSAGVGITCALNQEGFPQCFGNPVTIGEVPQVKLSEVACLDFCCGVKQLDSRPICWGGQTTPSSALNIPAVAVKGISVRIFQACALNEDDEAFCWGLEENEQLEIPPIKLTEIAAFDADVGVGGDNENFACGIQQSDGLPSCWGSSGSTSSRTDTTAIETPLSAISSTGVGTCGMRQSDGTVVCWGEPQIQDWGIPAELPFKQISIGIGLCGIQAVDDKVACFGVLPFLGLPESEEGFTEISLGFFHACGRTLSGVLECWGVGLNGETSVPPELNA